MNFPVMSVDDFYADDYYLARAEHYRHAKETAADQFTRYFLERMEHSYRVLAASETALAVSQNAEEETENPRDQPGT
ncbi:MULTISPECIES: hypothetical protein [Bradyrhizobium]|uniref:Uncharacterized protein n=1 Tax=Bradyrhizobium elkanii TaxID=29448 RepID=A0A4V6Y7C6_BRAEL|nr:MULTISPECIES: hypothetical protein [Bradyrhizobium]MTV16705.1 hypothetical protein [Bradyrhizobium sp. BR2003]TKV80405.1 hypothetical protein FDV58_16710 [Bradyrhizobium elkanii]